MFNVSPQMAVSNLQIRLKSDDELTRYQESSNLIVAGGERIEDPSAADEKSPLCIIVNIWQRSKAVRPQAQPIQFGSGNAIVAHYPAGRCKCQTNAYEGDHEQCNAAATRQCPSFHVCPVASSD